MGYQRVTLQLNSSGIWGEGGSLLDCLYWKLPTGAGVCHTKFIKKLIVVTNIYLRENVNYVRLEM